MRCVKDDNSGDIMKPGNGTGNFNKMVKLLFSKVQGTITFEVHSSGSRSATLSVYTISGKKVVKIVNTRNTAGSTKILWDGYAYDGKAVSNGTYYYELTVNNSKIFGQFAFVR